MCSVVQDQALADPQLPRRLLGRHGLADALHNLGGDVRLLVEMEDPGVVGDGRVFEGVLESSRLVRGAVAGGVGVGHDQRSHRVVFRKVGDRDVAHHFEGIRKQRPACHGVENHVGGFAHHPGLVAARDDAKRHGVVDRRPGMSVGCGRVAAEDHPADQVGDGPRDEDDPRDRAPHHQVAQEALRSGRGPAPDQRLDDANGDEDEHEEAQNGGAKRRVPQQVAALGCCARRP